jgi:CMP/dCMP kinase
VKNEYKNIIIAGDIGTGTSTLAKGLAEKLNWKYFSAGDFFREYHKNHNIPLWNKAAIPDTIDRKVDDDFLNKLHKSERIIIESHYSGWFAKDLAYVLKILLVADKEVSSKRILERQHTHTETLEEIEKRRIQLKEKFKKLYSEEDYENPKIFDLVVDTTHTNVEETLEKSYAALKKGYQK